MSCARFSRSPSNRKTSTLNENHPRPHDHACQRVITHSPRRARGAFCPACWDLEHRFGWTIERSPERNEFGFMGYHVKAERAETARALALETRSNLTILSITAFEDIEDHDEPDS